MTRSMSDDLACSVSRALTFRNLNIPGVSDDGHAGFDQTLCFLHDNFVGEVYVITEILLNGIDKILFLLGCVSPIVSAIISGFT
jgi:hypothetical protein